MKPLVPCLLARTFFRELKHHFDLVDCSAFWNLEFISLLNSMINVINAVVKFGGNSIFVRKSQNIKTLRIKDERKVALDMEENVLVIKELAVHYDYCPAVPIQGRVSREKVK